MGQYSAILDLLDGGGWEEGRQVEADQLRLLEFYIRDPVENQHRLRMKTFTSRVVEARGEGNRNWHWPQFEHPIHIQEWHHFCIAYSSVSRRIVMMHNGNMEVEHTRPQMVAELDDFVPSKWLGRMSDGSKTENLTRKGIIAMKKDNIQGKFTDFNVWDFFLSKEDMSRFTTCQEAMGGNLVAWDGEGWEGTPGLKEEELSVEEMEFSQICSAPSTLLFFQESLVWKEAVKVCKKFQGELAVTEAEEDYSNLRAFLDPLTHLPVWLRFTDSQTEGTWVDYETKKASSFPIPWLHISEPTGFIGLYHLDFYVFLFS